MANLLIDIGNTTLKASWAEGMTLGKTFRYQGEKKISFILSQTSKQKPEIMVISNIRSFSNQEVERLRGECGHLIILNDEVLKERNLPSYLTPDRAASIIASRYLFKGKGCTVPNYPVTCSKYKSFIFINYISFCVCYFLWNCVLNCSRLIVVFS